MAVVRFSLILFFLAGNLRVVARDGLFSGKYIDPAWYSGSVLPQNNNIRFLVHEHLHAFQLNAGINTDGSREWHQYLNYPRLGVGFYHSNLGNDQIFGKVNALYGTVAIKTFPRRFFINLEHNLTAGIGILTKHYSLEKNPLNVAFGAPVAFFLQYGLVVPVRVTPDFEIYGGPCFTHISAAKIIQPNLGLHMVMFRVGGRYNLTRVEYKNKYERQPLPVVNRHQIMLVAGGGIKQYNRLTPEKYGIYFLSSQYSYKVSHVFGLGGGLDFYLDNSVKPWIRDSQNKQARFDQIFHSTVHLAFLLYIGELAFLIQPGTYIYQNFGGYHDWFIYKFGFRYQISERYSVGAILKAHWLAKADFLELGVGYSFLKNKK
jgi:Lipid A 3-O-deacylase (PagL)